MENRAAEFQIPPASASWESAALWFKQHNPPRPMFHTQTGSEDLIAARGCCESVYFQFTVSPGFTTPPPELWKRSAGFIFSRFRTFRKLYFVRFPIRNVVLTQVSVELLFFFFFYLPVWLHEKMTYLNGPSGTFSAAFPPPECFWVTGNTVILTSASYRIMKKTSITKSVFLTKFQQ